MRGDARLRTDRKYNLHLVNADDCSGQYDMPELYPCDYVPEHIKDFNYSISSKETNFGVHFFIDDYRFERIWNDPIRYTKILSRFDCVLTPDFSLYTDMPLPMQQWNEYRRRALGNFWQRMGLTVIPTLSWSYSFSYDFCFDGIPKNSTCAVSTVGVKRNKQSRKLWCEGMCCAIETVNPKNLIVYGGMIEELNFSDINVFEYNRNTSFTNEGE